MEPREDGTAATEEQQSAPERVKARALDVATRLFAEKGIHSVSVREIARETGVSHTLLHLYFGSKNEILRQCLARYDQSIVEAFSEHEDVAAGVADEFRRMARNTDVLRITASALVEGLVPDVVDMSPEAQLALARRLSTNPDAKIDPNVLAMGLSLMTFGWGVTSKWMVEKAGMDEAGKDAVIEGLATLMERMVRDYS